MAFQITLTFLFLGRFQKFKNWIEAQLLLYLPVIIPTRFFLKYPKKGVGGRREPRIFFSLPKTHILIPRLNNVMALLQLLVDRDWQLVHTYHAPVYA